MTAVLGGLGTFGAFVVAMVLDPVVLATGGGWMIAGTLLYVAYRRYKGLPLRETVKVESADAARGRGGRVQERPGRLREDEPFSRRRWRPRRRWRRGGGARSTCSRWSRCRRTCRSTPSSTAARARRRRKIERAKLICGQRVSGAVEHVRLGQAGRRSSSEAKEINAAAIVMQLRYRNGAPLYGKTLQTVLAERPCRVIVAAQARATRSTEPSRRSSVAGGDDGGEPASRLPTRSTAAVTRIFAVIILGFGVVILVVTLANGGGAASAGFWLGLVFTGARGRAASTSALTAAASDDRSVPDRHAARR